MKYMLFAGRTHYPDGGWHDFKGLFATVDLAIVAVGEHNDSYPCEDEWAWWQVVNATSLELAASS